MQIPYFNGLTDSCLLCSFIKHILNLIPMRNNLLLRKAGDTSYFRVTGFAAITSCIVYLLIQQLLQNAGSNSLLMIAGVFALLVSQSYVKSMSAVDPADEEDDACGGDRGIPTDDSDLPVAEGGVA